MNLFSDNSTSHRLLIVSVLTLLLSACTDERPSQATLSIVSDSTSNFEMNAVSFRRSGIQTEGQYQFLAFYDSSNRVAIARRKLNSDDWSVFRTSFEDQNSGATDTHNVISFGIDEDGYLHMAWGMHNHPLLYAKSNAPVLNESSISFRERGGMTGENESSVTYPQFYKFPSGELAFLWRDGKAGNGNICLNTYSAVDEKWQRLHCPLISGTKNKIVTSPYPQNLAFGAKNEIFLLWTERSQRNSITGERGYQTNHNFYAAVSYDQGRTWNPYSGNTDQPPAPIDPPITKDNSALVLRIPEGSSLINQTSLTIDHEGNPLLAGWWAPKVGEGDHTRQYMLAWPEESGWVQSAVSERPPEQKKSEEHVRDLARPVVLTDRCGGVYVLSRFDERNHRFSVAHSSDRTNWEFLDLSQHNAFPQEPVIDHELWHRGNSLHFIYGFNETVATGTKSQIGVLQWQPDLGECNLAPES